MKTKTVFDLHEDLEQYFETADGAKFFTEHDAKHHARSIKKMEIKKVKRSAHVSKPKSKTPGGLTPAQKAKQRVEAIGKMETVEEVEAALEGETAKTVKEAGQKRIEELKPVETVDKPLDASKNDIDQTEATDGSKE